MRWKRRPRTDFPGTVVALFEGNGTVPREEVETMGYILIVLFYVTMGVYVSAKAT